MLQNTLLGSLVVFASLLVLCNTQCYVELYDKNPEDPPDVLPSPEVLIPQSARRSSTRTLAATPWWSWRTRTRNVQSARGSCEELVGPGPPAGPDSPMYSPAYQ
nr:uncharacterized protein LOC100340890 isoform X2 [Oryctolagus cuniculus]